MNYLSYKKVLLIRPDKAGDAIKTIPVLRALIKQNLDVEFHLLLSSHNYSLFEQEPGFTLHRLPEIPAISFDVAILLPCDVTLDTENILSKITAKTKFSTRELPLPRQTPAKREETKNIATLVGNALNVNLIPLIYEVPKAPLLSKKDSEEALENMGGDKQGLWLGICPFAGMANRTHPFRSWKKLVPKLTKNSSFQKFFIFGTEQDRPQMEILKAKSKTPERIVLCYPSSFRSLGAYLKRLDGLIAVDSGPLHLAHSLDVPSLGVLSGGDVERWFKRLSPKDSLIPRGIFSRYPTALEMWLSFKKWNAALMHSP